MYKEFNRASELQFGFNKERRREGKKKKIVGEKKASKEENGLHEKRVATKLNDVLRDDTNPLKAEFNSRLNIHSRRYSVAPKVLTCWYGSSFVPTAINVLNQRGRGQTCFRMIE